MYGCIHIEYRVEYIPTKSIISLHIGCECRRMFSVLISDKRSTLFPYIVNVMIM